MRDQEVLYNVFCIDCGRDWTPNARSPLWWQAKKKADAGYLDALGVSGVKCGCAKAPHKPDALYRVVGIDFDCQGFDIPCDTMVEACRVFLRESLHGSSVFVTGLSVAVEQDIKLLPWKRAA